MLKRLDYWLKAPWVLDTHRAIHDFPFWCFILFHTCRKHEKRGSDVHYLRTLSCRLCFQKRADMIMQFVRSPPPVLLSCAVAIRALVPSSDPSFRHRVYFREFLYDTNMLVRRNFRMLTFVTADNLHSVINGNPSNHWEYQRLFLHREELWA